jgi:hypothetical protein
MRLRRESCGRTWPGDKYIDLPTLGKQAMTWSLSLRELHFLFQEKGVVSIVVMMLGKF